MPKRRKNKPKILTRDSASLITAVVVVLSFLVLFSITGCGSSEEAKASGSCSGREVPSSSQSRCFVVECDGNPVGGNCL